MTFLFHYENLIVRIDSQNNLCTSMCICQPILTYIFQFLLSLLGVLCLSGETDPWTITLDIIDLIIGNSY